MGIRESQRPGKVSCALAREFCWLAICQFCARAKGSHHRLDHCEHVERHYPPLVLDRAARHSGNRRYRDQLLSNQCNVGGQHRLRSQDRQIANHPHLDSNPRHVANHRWHVLARECNWSVATELIRPDQKKARPKHDLAFWARWPTTNCWAPEAIFRSSFFVVVAPPPCVAHKPQVPTP